FFQAEDGIRDFHVTGVQTCALPISFAPSSPAFDGGTSCAVVVDQRYVPRDGSCDIGAFELTDFTTVKVAVAASQTVDKADGWVVVTGTITCSRDESFDLAVDVAQQ